MSLFVQMHPIEGMRDLAMQQWAHALRKAGHTVVEHSLLEPSAAPENHFSELSAKIRSLNPDAIFTHGGMGFHSPQFYLRPEIAEIPLLSFWFDDPLRPVSTFMRKPRYLDALRRPRCLHFVWDGYWRDWLWEKHAVRSLPIHLAADPEEFHPDKRIVEHSSWLVFVGTLSGKETLEKIIFKMPPLLRKVAYALEKEVAAASYGAQPYHLLDAVIAGRSETFRQAILETREKDPDAWLALCHYAWHIGKNETRRRLLREAMKVGPLLILAGNLERSQAAEHEWKAALGETRFALRVIDTGHMRGDGLNTLYRHGCLHLQATDPQSVESGIPFRVFQTTACARPLISDIKPGLASCYDFEKEILTFSSDKDAAEKIAFAFSRPALLEEVAEAGHKRFLLEHTWKNRIEYVLQKTAAEFRVQPDEKG